MKIFHKITYRFPAVRVAAAAIMLTVLASSCKKDFLVEAPELELPQEEAYTTPQRVDKVITGLYSSAKSGSLFGGRYQVYNDIRAEEYILRDPNNVTGADVYQATNDATNSYISSFWSVGYSTINRANLAIDGLTQNVAGLAPAVIDPALGEAKFIRALVYFQLVQIFAKPYVLNGGTSRGLPLRLIPETTLANNSLASSTVAEVYAQILKDLDEAEAQLPATYTTALAKTTRAHKNTAIALKTRVYLTMANYAKVKEEGNKIVPQAAPFSTTVGAGHALAGNVTTVFVTPYTVSESIFSFPMAATNAPGTQNQLAYYYNSFSGANLIYPLNKNAPGIYADPIWPATDARKVGFTALFTGSGLTAQPVLKKYNTPSPWTDFVPMIRYAEVLLNVAEAEAAAGGNAVRARALLDAVRRRSDATYNFGVLAGAALTETILKERRIELLGEGHRYNDLARLNRALPAIGAAGLTIAVSDPRYTFPIPINERNTNPLVGE
ncbi:RagB/SusD family nutrient uptake outer membrane protein [Pedobacter sp.]|uniref:RagB/SusD family nutrient uptake outer membrane protein n=1 Tax=Pedobacter sp. TaxID=1411316 RepID=UPI003D7F8645